MDTNAATSAPETTTSTPSTPSAAPASTPTSATPAASTTATPATPSASTKADTANTDGKNKFNRPTPRQALEQAAAKVRERQGAAASVSATAVTTPKTAPAAATGSAPQATAVSTGAPQAAPTKAPQSPTATPAGQQAAATTQAPAQAYAQAASTFPADRPRDADGKFKKLPRGWKSALAQQFETLPPEVQEEAHRREDAAYDGIKQYTDAAARWGEMEKAIQPYMATIRQMGATPTQAVQYLFNIDHTLRYGSPLDKQRTLAQVAQTFGVDLGQLAQVPQESQEVAQLRQQLAQMNQQLQSFQQAQGQAQLTPYMAQIQQFKAEQGHEHFDELEPAMTGLIASGTAKTLAEAYEQALWARPDLRESKLREQRQQWEQEQQARVEAAQSASVQVRGAPSAPAQATPIDAKNRRAVILDAFRNLQQT